MSAPTLKPPKPRSRLGRLATLDRLATVLTWVFWLTAVFTALQQVVDNDPVERNRRVAKLVLKKLSK